MVQSEIGHKKFFILGRRRKEKEERHGSSRRISFVDQHKKRSAHAKLRRGGPAFHFLLLRKEGDKLRTIACHHLGRERKRFQEHFRDNLLWPAERKESSSRFRERRERHHRRGVREGASAREKGTSGKALFPPSKKSEVLVTGEGIWWVEMVGRENDGE